MGLFGAGVGYATARFQDRQPQAVTGTRYVTSGLCLAIGGALLGVPFA